MRLKDFDYYLPKNLIAQKPISPRDHSRLLLLDRKTGKIQHKHFYNIVDYLNKGDVLVVNNTKVMAARLIGKRAGTGGKVEVFLLKKIKVNIWQCLAGGHKRKESLKIEFEKGLKAEILKNNKDGTWNVKFNKRGTVLMKIVEKIGKIPLPPYIKRNQDSIASLQNDKKSYQTVYADEKKLGSVAAPTAGFHFTPALLKKLKNKGVQIEYVTLQVGLGTFAPVKVEDITKHKMHSEWIEVDKKTLTNILKAKKEGRRIIAVGTTSVRTLESLFKNYSSFCHCEEQQRRSNLTYSALNQRLLRHPEYGASRNDRNYSAWTDIFIYPSYKFKIVDAMITNFHLPKSTLLMLISAFAGRSKIFKAYEQAIKKKYRFFSYGDAMLIV
jgi:S-adenosylmethionine:tRNA ribosyltransferase-isomerase